MYKSFFLSRLKAFPLFLVLASCLLFIDHSEQKRHI